MLKRPVNRMQIPNKVTQFGMIPVRRQIGLTEKNFRISLVFAIYRFFKKKFFFFFFLKKNKKESNWINDMIKKKQYLFPEEGEKKQ